MLTKREARDRLVDVRLFLLRWERLPHLSEAERLEMYEARKKVEAVATFLHGEAE